MLSIERIEGKVILSSGRVDWNFVFSFSFFFGQWLRKYSFTFRMHYQKSCIFNLLQGFLLRQSLLFGGKAQWSSVFGFHLPWSQTASASPVGPAWPRPHCSSWLLIPTLWEGSTVRRGGKLISSVQSLSLVWLFVTPWTAARPASLSITNSRGLLKLMSIESVMPSNHLILCHPLLLPPSIFPSIRVFSNESVLPIRWTKYWNFSFSISPSNECSGLISFRMDWLDLLVVQGTLKSLLQHHSSKTSILQHLAFFIVQLSHPYMITGKP